MQASNESTGAYYDNYMLQTNMLTITLMLETDLRDIGKYYTRTNTAPTPIRTAKQNEFSFIVNGNTIDWIVGDTIEYNSKINPHLRYLRRNVNGVEHKMDLGLTKMVFKYWYITDPLQIHYVLLFLWIAFHLLDRWTSRSSLRVHIDCDRMIVFHIRKTLHNTKYIGAKYGL